MSEFLENLEQVFASFGAVHTRRMFGGYGVFHDGLMFGLVADDVLYLKADGRSAGLFENRGLPQFEYEKNTGVVRMSYFMAPEEIFDDPDTARDWAVRAFEAALRSRKPTGGTNPPRR